MRTKGRVNEAQPLLEPSVCSNNLYVQLPFIKKVWLAFFEKRHFTLFLIENFIIGYLVETGGMKNYANSVMFVKGLKLISRQFKQKLFVLKWVENMMSAETVPKGPIA